MESRGVFDTGEFSFDGVTRNNQPVHSGVTSEPGATVFLYGRSTIPGSAFILLGRGTSGGSKFWSITPTVKLADGKYNVFAKAVDVLPVFTTSTLTLLASGSLGNSLVVDTVGPKVRGVFLKRANGAIDLALQDNLSGLNQTQVVSAASYTLAKLNTRTGQYQVNAIATSRTGPTGPEGVVLSINNGVPLRGGVYTFTVHDSLKDVAGNPLDGEFFGFFPSGNNVPGADFVPELDSIHHTVYAPESVIGNASPVVPVGTPSLTVKIPTIPVKKSAASVTALKKAQAMAAARVPLAHVTQAANLSRAATTKR